MRPGGSKIEPKMAPGRLWRASWWLLGPLGVVLAALGALLAALVALLGPSWRLLGLFWRLLGALLVPLGALLGLQKTPPEALPT